MARIEENNNEQSHTVALSRGDLRAARRLLQLLSRTEVETLTSQLVHSPAVRIENASREALIGRAKEEFSERSRRSALFGTAMFGEPAWEMLLALYILDVSGQRQTIGALLQFSSMSMSTAKRWLDYLELHGLVTREEHPTDKRTSFVRLTDSGREKLDMYFSETNRTSA